MKHLNMFPIFSLTSNMSTLMIQERANGLHEYGIQVEKTGVITKP